MITYSIPHLSFSDYIAIAAIIVSMGALIVSIISAGYTKRQTRSTEFATHNNYRANLTVHHQRFLQALRESQQSHKAHIDSLTKLASSSLDDIIKLSDEFDTQRWSSTSERPLRHVLTECAEIVFYAFKGQLAWQSGRNISGRIYRVSQIEFDLKPTEERFLGPDFRRTLELGYLRNPNTYQESILAHDPYFCSLVTQLQTRIDGSRHSEWTNLVQQKLAPFTDLHESKSTILKAGAESLEEIIEQGKREHFSLRESPVLYRSLQRQRTILETLSSLLLPRISERDAHHYLNYASISVAICATIFVVINSGHWGWEQREQI